MTTADDDVLAAAVLQLADHSEQLTGLDQRETAHHQDTASELSQLRRRVDSTSARIDTIAATLSGHAAAVNTLTDLGSQVGSLTRQLSELAARDQPGPSSYQPVPAPRWWQLTDAEQQRATDRLRAWVDQIYRPGYSHLAAALPPCWDQHPLCLYTLDWLSELWSALYLDPHRTTATLAAQAEWQTRLLPAAADQMAHAAAGCHHSRASPYQPPQAARPYRPRPGGT
jgi:hypothetical protein